MPRKPRVEPDKPFVYPFPKAVRLKVNGATILDAPTRVLQRFRGAGLTECVRNRKGTRIMRFDHVYGRFVVAAPFAEIYADFTPEPDFYISQIFVLGASGKRSMPSLSIYFGGMASQLAIVPYADTPIDSLYAWIVESEKDRVWAEPRECVVATYRGKGPYPRKSCDYLFDKSLAKC
jgi:hypothetical protein